MLEIENLRVAFGNIVAVDHFNMTISPNTIHSLIGPNGAGKTTVFNAIFNFVPYSGKITFLDHDLGKIPQYERISLGLARTFQNLSLFYSMNVEENVKLGLFAFLKTNMFKDFVGFDVFNRKEVEKQVNEALELVNIVPLAKAYPVFLPHGTQKLVELARAIVSKPKLVMLDEPAAGLNDEEKIELKKVLLKIKDMGITILIVEHDMGIVMDISDIVTVMSYGEKIAEGTPEAVSKNEDVIQAYLGVEDA
ncbi:MAG: ABC transporter ATP-binding protein [Candidatus Atribacteria bacterium]|nr:ABC transporter ATP-binding protein [Candidatus Atribacteria bacterium]